MQINPVHRGSCHCGAVVFEVELPDGLVEPRRCNCSLCRRRGAVMGYVPLSGLRLLRGEDALRVYRFNTRAVPHYFCAHCGVYTHHQRRSNPGQYGFNVGCLDGVDPFELGEVPVLDGVNHPEDRP